jgi:mannose-6-phosphate isomerase-like protein (cupin superfamily)
MYHNDDTASCRAFLSKDTELNWHIHEQKEFLIVYKGILEVDIEPDMLCEICIGKNKIDGNKIILGVGDCICLQPNVEHKVYSPEDTWVYSITIPADPSYPI